MALIEACNAVPDADKRLRCLQEAMRTAAGGERNDARTRQLEDLERAFANIRGAVNAGVSFQQYDGLSLAPASAVAVFRSQANTVTDPAAVDALEEAAQAYRDAAKVWRAQIFESKDAGVFGRILDVNYTGLSGLVTKYNLQTRRVLLSDHLSADDAVRAIWQIAAIKADSAMAILKDTGAPDEPFQFAGVTFTSSGNAVHVGRTSPDSEWSTTLQLLDLVTHCGTERNTSRERMIEIQNMRDLRMRCFGTSPNFATINFRVEAAGAPVYRTIWKRQAP